MKQCVSRLMSLALPLSLVLVIALSFSGCQYASATASDADIGPKLEELKDPNPYANYKAAMASNKDHPMAYEWQTANETKVAAATTVEALAPFVKDEASALALLAQVKGAYATDPIVATQIASVTQLVMCPKCNKAAAARKVWVAALEKTRDATQDEYVKTFCAQQLRLCRY